MYSQIYAQTMRRWQIHQFYLLDTGAALVGPKRTKRSVDCRNKCRNNADPVVKTILAKRNGYKSCDRVAHCKNGRCHWKHLTRNNYYQCCCCPEHTSAQACYKTWGKCTYKRSYWG